MQKVHRFLGKIPPKFVCEILIVAGGLFLLGFIVSVVSPYSPPKQYTFVEAEDTAAPVLRATVHSVSKDSIEVTLQDSPRKGSSVTIPYYSAEDRISYQPGSSVIVIEKDDASGVELYGPYRLPALLFIVGLFVAVVLLVGRRRGLMSLAGLGASIIVIGWMIIPLVIAGYNSLLVTILGAYIIGVVSLLAAHGFKKRTYISLLSVFIVLVLVTIGSQIVVAVLGLTGIIDEASDFLRIDQPNIDLSGMLVGGIVIASLGALDDIVTTQVATVDELKKANASLTVRDLYTKAFSVGGEHIAALVNTLALVYVGAALPLIVAYVIMTPDVLLLFNSEFIVTEIARTIVVSIGLVVAVPISTLLAAVILSKKQGKK